MNKKQFLPKNLARIIKFGTTGLSGLIIDFTITYYFIEFVHLTKLTANSIGFISACLSNYTLNRVWTFKGTDSPTLRALATFFGVSIIGLVLNSIIVYTLINYFHANLYIAKLFAVAAVFFYNYLANSLITFRIKEDIREIKIK